MTLPAPLRFLADALTPVGGSRERTVSALRRGDLDGAARERLLEIADRCPVSRTLSRGGEVRSRLDNATGVLLEPGA